MPKMSTAVTVYKNASVVMNGKISVADIAVSDGIISGIYEKDHTVSDCLIDSTENKSVSEVDFSGLFIFPGFIDVHVHTREPGFSYKETIRTASDAAAAGGYTEICPMPNLNPVPDCLEALGKQCELIKMHSDVGMHPFGAITVGEKGEYLADLAGMAENVIGFSDDGRGVQNAEIMRMAMLETKRLGKIISAHCEDNSYLHGGYVHEGHFAARHGLVGISSESEWKPLERDIELLRDTKAAYHVCHVSTKESVELIRNAKREGIDITAETAPHYLILCDEDIKLDSSNNKFGGFFSEGRFKMNPPLRTDLDRMALVEGVADGTIDMIATDHAPHSFEEKVCGLEKSPFGVVGLETAFSELYTKLVLKNVISLEKLIDIMHYAPSRRFGIGSDIAVGADADFTVFDLNKEYTVDPEKFRSMGRFTPFAGDRVYGFCVMTVRKGNVIWKSMNSKAN